MILDGNNRSIDKLILL